MYWYDSDHQPLFRSPFYNKRVDINKNIHNLVGDLIWVADGVYQGRDAGLLLKEVQRGREKTQRHETEDH